jgi:hypothetical protein
VISFDNDYFGELCSRYELYAYAAISDDEYMVIFSNDDVDEI